MRKSFTRVCEKDEFSFLENGTNFSRNGEFSWNGEFLKNEKFLADLRRP